MLTLQELKSHVAEKEENRAKYLFRSGDKLLENLTAAGLTPEEAFLDSYDRNMHFAMGFHDNKEWLFQGFKSTQQLTYDALLDASDLYMFFVNNLIVKASYMRWFMEVGGRLIEIRLQNVWETRDEMSLPLETHRDYKNNVSELGNDLALAYSTYCKGFTVPKSVIPGHKTDELPVLWEQIYVPMLRSKGVDDPDNCPARRIKSLLKKEFVFLYDQFPYLRLDHQTDSKFETGATPSLRLFLETRSDKNQSEGDYIIMQTPKNSDDILKDNNDNPMFFRVKNHNWMNVERLKNPSLAIDHYVARKLKNESIDFNFDQYCEAI